MNKHQANLGNDDQRKRRPLSGESQTNTEADPARNLDRLEKTIAQLQVNPTCGKEPGNSSFKLRITKMERIPSPTNGEAAKGVKKQTHQTSKSLAEKRPENTESPAQPQTSRQRQVLLENLSHQSSRNREGEAKLKMCAS